MDILTYENAVKALYCAQILQDSRVGIFVNDSSFLRDKAEYLAKLGHGKIYSTLNYCEIYLQNGSIITLRPPVGSARGCKFDYALYDGKIDINIVNTIIAPTEKSSRMKVIFCDLMDAFDPKRLFE